MATSRAAASGSPAAARAPAATACARTGAPVHQRTASAARTASSPGSLRTRARATRWDISTLPVSGSWIFSPRAAASYIRDSAGVRVSFAGAPALLDESGPGSGRGARRVRSEVRTTGRARGGNPAIRLRADRWPPGAGPLPAGPCLPAGCRRWRSPDRARCGRAGPGPPQRVVPGKEARRQGLVVVGVPRQRQRSSLRGPALRRSCETECWSSRASAAVTPGLAGDVLPAIEARAGFELGDDLTPGSGELGAQTLDGKRYVRLVLWTGRCGRRRGQDGRGRHRVPRTAPRRLPPR